MRFEHLVKMFDDRVGQALISRRQLWLGLVLRAEEPMRFDENITSARILSYDETGMRREVQFGSLLVRELVRFVDQSTVRYETEPSEQHMRSVLTMSIEEPQPEHLFVRFVYENDLPDAAPSNDSNDPGYYVPYLKSAYQQADQLTAQTILTLARDGVLGSP